MCLIVSNRNRRIPLIAKKTIKCYKIIPLIAKKTIKCYKIIKKTPKGCISQFRKFSYKFNRMYTTKLDPLFGDTINRGFHAYTCKRDTLYKSIRLSSSDYFPRRIYAAIECSIPKGAEYFRGINQDIVSNKIILKKIIKLK